MNVYVDIYDFTNRGDWLMLEAVVAQVRARFPYAGIAIPRSAYEQETRWCDERFLWPINTSCRWYRRPRLRDGMPARAIDLVLFAPGYRYGDPFFGDTPLGERDKAPFRAFTKRGRRIILLPQAFGPFEHASTRQALQAVFSEADRVYARDRVSHRYLTQLLGDDPKVALAPDFTCLFRPDADVIPFRAGDYVVVIPNVNMELRTAAETSSRYLDSMVAGIAHLQKRGERVVLLNHEGPRDERVILRINRMLESPAYVVTRATAAECKSVVARAKLVVSSRFHGVVSALTEGVPTICTSWSHKYEELIGELGCPESMVGCEDPVVMTNRIDKALGNPEKFTASSDRLSALRGRVGEMWNEVFEGQK